MQSISEYDTIFYKLQLKRTRTPAEVFAKMQKTIKKKGATKNWVCTVDSENGCMSVDFGIEESETFCIFFDEKKTCNGICKVFFPLAGELFEDEKTSGFKALINMIYAARESFSKMEITDDYGISESYLDSKVNKIALRELTDDEAKRAERLFKDGHETVKEFITALMFDYRGLPCSEDFMPYINRYIGNRPLGFMLGGNVDLWALFSAFVDSFLYETAEYHDKGRLSSVRDYYGDLNGVHFSACAFIDGVNLMTGYSTNERACDPKSVQVLRLFQNKYRPLMESEKSDFDKCVLSYRFFVSTMDYLGFKVADARRKSGALVGEAFAVAAKRLLEAMEKGERQEIDEACKNFDEALGYVP